MFCNSSPISNYLLSLVLCKYVCIIFYTAVYIEQIRHKSVHKSSVPDSDTLFIIIIVKAYLNVLFSCQICMFICMYVCMHVCTKSFLKTTTNSSCVCTHLANKADSDSDSDNLHCICMYLCLLIMYMYLLTVACNREIYTILFIYLFLFIF